MTTTAPATLDAARTAAPAPRGALRTGTALVLSGAVAEYAVTTLHAHREAPNDHVHVFAEYAASGDWIAVHLGQFAAGLVLLVGLLALLHALRDAGTPAAVAQVGTALAVLAGAVLAVLQAVDGVTLGRAVGSLAAAPPGQRDAWFHDAEIVRWGEEGVASYSQLTLGLAVAAVGVAVLGARALPRWTAVPALAAGASLAVNGVVVGYAGFGDEVLPSVVGWAALAVFAVTTTIGAWRHRA